MPKIRGIKPETWTDENFVELSPLARLLFIGLWNYACDHGHVEDKPKQIKMRVLPADECNCSELLGELADRGRIVRDGGWITIPTLTEHQRIDKRWFVSCDKPGCAKPEGKKADSQRAPRGGHHEASTSPPRSPGVASWRPRADVDGDVDGELMVMVNKSEAVAPESPSTDLVIASRDDVARLCEHLANRIEANGSKRPNIGKGWLDAARLMLDNDDRSEQQIHAAIDWSQSDDFWKANIQSMPKLREKYDVLRLQAQRGTKARSNGDIDWDAAMQRAKARDERDAS